MSLTMQPAHTLLKQGPRNKRFVSPTSDVATGIVLKESRVEPGGVSKPNIQHFQADIQYLPSGVAPVETADSCMDVHSACGFFASSALILQMG